MGPGLRELAPKRADGRAIRRTVADVAVIGGGIVGMATARELRNRGFEVVVLEAETKLGEHQTGRNSGVIHSGIYYKPGSFKARLCAEGREAMFRFCEEHGIRHERCGKVIVATRPELVRMLDELERRGIANGLAPRRCTREEIAEHEPHVSCLAGLFVEETGIVRYNDVLEAMAKDVDVRLGARVERIARDHLEFVIGTNDFELRARNLVNCAGLQCDRIARMAGADPDLSIIPFRGEYFDLVPDRRSLCKNLIYPVPDPAFPFLGVHLTRSPDGHVEAGPNAVLAMRREGYTKTAFAWDDVVEVLGYRGFWQMAARHMKMGAYEMVRSLHKPAFVRAVQELVPEVRAEDLEPGRAGVRAQAVLRDGTLVDDFRFAAGDGMLHVLNAPSPAATASLAIARHIADTALPLFRTKGSS
jgi:L-2-hydroxyglutarate oxidase